MTTVELNKVKINNPVTLKINRRQRTSIIITITSIIILSVILGGIFLSNSNISTHLNEKYLSPSLSHPFGTDWLGRDMLTRTIKGLTLSIGVGVLSTCISVFIALILGMSAATMGKAVDSAVCWIIDLCMGAPHLVILIMIAFTLGGGMKGVVVGVALTHWPSLTRVIRAEVMQLRSKEFVQVSRQFGKSRWWIAKNHILPHIMPQLFVGSVLLFPHVILHEASITFLGFGLSPHKPAIGIILSESMKYLSTGMWWLAFFPGLMLLIIVRQFDILGNNIRALVDPHSTNE